jgi:hypothetical protein
MTALTRGKLRSITVATGKDIQIAKALINKGLISRAEMQRHLDDLDEILNSGAKKSIEQLLKERRVFSAQELKHLVEAPKKRLVHCNKCNTMYSVQEEDIGRRFKCRQCNAWLLVPPPGQTQARPIKEIRKEIEEKQKADEMIPGVVENNIPLPDDMGEEPVVDAETQTSSRQTVPDKAAEKFIITKDEEEAAPKSGKGDTKKRGI